MVAMPNNNVEIGNVMIVFLSRALIHRQAIKLIDKWPLDGVAKALCGAVGTCIKSHGRPVCTCSRCAPGAGGDIACALSGNNETSNNRKENRNSHSRKFLSSSFFYSHQSVLQEFEVNHQLLRRHFLKKMIYLADHRPKKNSNEGAEWILWFYFFCDGISTSAKLVHICWIINLYVSTSSLPHSSVCFRLK